MATAFVVGCIVVVVVVVVVVVLVLVLVLVLVIVLVLAPRASAPQGEQEGGQGRRLQEEDAQGEDCSRGGDSLAQCGTQALVLKELAACKLAWGGTGALVVAPGRPL